MGTKNEIKNESQELVNEIKRLLSELDWSQNRLARILFMEFNEWNDNEDEIKKFEGKLKKELQRSTTKPVLLRKYIDVIVRHDEAKKLNLIFNKYVPQNSISTSLSDAMKGVSKEIERVHGFNSEK